MPLFGGKKKQTAFEIPLTMTRREKLAMKRAEAADRAIAVLAREKKKQAERDAMIEKAEALKDAARKREEAAEAKRKRQAAATARANRDKEPAQKTACTCRKPQLDRHGLCRRCHKLPAGRRRRLPDRKGVGEDAW